MKHYSAIISEQIGEQLHIKAKIVKANSYVEAQQYIEDNKRQNEEIVALQYYDIENFEYGSSVIFEYNPCFKEFETVEPNED
jgi:hypothetical protein